MLRKLLNRWVTNCIREVIQKTLENGGFKGFFKQMSLRKFDLKCTQTIVKYHKISYGFAYDLRQILRKIKIAYLQRSLRNLKETIVDYSLI